jgi:predicted DNA-binding WGR domain protein
MATLAALNAMTNFRKMAVENGDQKWDRAEIGLLTHLAKEGDSFSKEGVSFMLGELNGPTTFEPEAKNDLFDVLVHQAKVDPRQITAAPPPVTLAVQEGGSNKFYQLQLAGDSLTTRWGKIGTAGQSKVETFESSEAAIKAFMSTLRSKMAKGYQKIDPAALGPAEKPAVVEKPAAQGTSGLADLASFDPLSTDKKREILDWAGSATKHGLTASGEMSLDKITDPAEKKFAQEMLSAADDSTGGFEVHDDEYIRVGEVRIEVEIFKLPSGEIAGGTLRAFQQGVEQPDDYWDNEDAYPKEKLAEMADQTDVSWQAHGTYANSKSGELIALREPDYMEWSGY